MTALFIFGAIFCAVGWNFCRAEDERFWGSATLACCIIGGIVGAFAS